MAEATGVVAVAVEAEVEDKTEDPTSRKLIPPAEFVTRKDTKHRSAKTLKAGIQIEEQIT